MATAFLAAIGAIGLNILTGWAGQVSLGHAFFLGIGAYTGAALAGDPDGRVTGLGLDMWVWLPRRGSSPALVGLAVAPVATRLRGPLPRDRDARPRLPRRAPVPRARRASRAAPASGARRPSCRCFGIDLDGTSQLLGIALDRPMKLYFLSLALLVIFAAAREEPDALRRWGARSRRCATATSPPS